MDPMTQLKDEHGWILREMEDIGRLFFDPDPGRMEELRGRLSGLWIFLLRHERLEEEWATGGWRNPTDTLPATEMESLHREHCEILTYLDSLEQALIDLKGYPHNYWRRSSDRETIRAQVEQVFRFVREHIGRENAGLLSGMRGVPGASK
jgi:hypothetical protein